MTDATGGTGGSVADSTGGTVADPAGGSSADPVGGSGADSAGSAVTGATGGSAAGSAGGLGAGSAGGTGGSGAGSAGGSGAGSTGGAVTGATGRPPLDPARFRAVFLLLLVTGISLLFLLVVRPFLTALFLGAIFSGLLHPVHERLARRFGGREGLAAAATLALFIFLLLGPSFTFLGIVAGQAVQVGQSAGPWIEEMAARFQELGGLAGLLDRIPLLPSLMPGEELMERLRGIGSSALGVVGQWLTGVTAATGQAALSLFVMLYAMFFFLKDGRRILRKVLYYLPLSDEDERRMLDRFVSVTRAMVKGTFLIGLMQGALAGLGFWVVGIPAAAFWGTVMAVLSVVPAVGASLVFLPAAVYLFATGQVPAGIGLIVWCGLIVGSLDNLLRPRLVGRDTRMSDLMILLGTLGGIFAFGMAGVLIGPIVAALFITVWELYGEAFRDILPDTRFARRDPAPAAGPAAAPAASSAPTAKAAALPAVGSPPVAPAAADSSSTGPPGVRGATAPPDVRNAAPPREAGQPRADPSDSGERGRG